MMNAGRLGPPGAPMSPNESEWSGYSHYQTGGGGGPPPPPGSLGGNGPRPQSPGFRPQSPGFMPRNNNLASPPHSASSNGPMSMGNGLPLRGGPSPPNSVGARSSYGTTMSSSEAKRRQNMQMEERLSQHYGVLRRFLGPQIRDERTGMRPNRARDKLLRLSGIQFQELSTDVYDELRRRQSAEGPQGSSQQVPPYLLPKTHFHPKRNQARQKLATLPPPRFRDLACDVFFELERRFPHFTGEVPRVGSPGFSPPSRSGTPNSLRPPRNMSISGASAMTAEDDYGRPTARQFQSNTIIPNKSTMVEDDDDDVLSDVYASRRDTTYTHGSGGATSEKDRKALADFEVQVGELQGKIRELEDKVREKDADIDRLEGDQQQHGDVHADLEAKLQSARDLNASLQAELDKVQHDQDLSEREYRRQLDAMSSRAADDNQWKSRYEALDQSHQALRDEVREQARATSEVRQEANAFMEQMQTLSERSAQAVEREEQLVTRLRRAEQDLEDWKHRYARARTHARNHGGGPLAIRPADAALLKNERAYIAPDGLIKDVHLTQYQVAIDEFLQSARSDEPRSVLAQVKHVVIAVRAITLDVGDASASPSLGGDSQQQKTVHNLKLKVSATANNLITAAKNFSLSHGVAPLSLLDAAASHLSMAIVALAQLVKISHSPASALRDDEDDHHPDDDIVDHLMDSPPPSAGVEDVYFSNGDTHHQNNGLEESMLTSRVYAGGSNASNGSTHSKTAPAMPNGNHLAPPSVVRRDSTIDELRTFLDSRTSTLLATLQSLVSAIRNSDTPSDILDSVASLTSTTRQMIQQTSMAVEPSTPPARIAQRLAGLVERMEEKGREGEDIRSEGVWNDYVKALPPLGFEIAREVKELGGWVEDELHRSLPSVHNGAGVMNGASLGTGNGASHGTTPGAFGAGENFS